jgi:hypothetical protein
MSYAVHVARTECTLNAHKILVGTWVEVSVTMDLAVNKVAVRGGDSCGC